MIRHTSGSITILALLMVSYLTFMILGITVFHSTAVWVTFLALMPVSALAYALLNWEGEDNEAGFYPYPG